MRKFHRCRSLGLVAAALVVSACGDDSIPDTASACAHQLGEACVGVPQGPVCDTDVCTANVDCSHVVTVASDAALASAAASATAGTCIALSPGAYAPVVLPGGVSLLGKGASYVTIGGVQVGAGSAAVVRGMKVTTGGVYLDGATDARIESVRVVRSAEDGIQASGGSSFSAVMIDVDGSGRYGIGVLDAAGATIDGAAISGGAGPGIWAQCSDGCACAQHPELTITSSLIQNNKIVGVSLIGVAGTLDHVDVRDNTEQVGTFIPGGGISASQCSTLTATALRVLDNTSFGVLVDNSKATVGASGNGLGVEVSRNAPGFWVQHLAQDGTQPVELQYCELEANSGVALGVSGESKGIMFWNSAVTGTVGLTVPVLENGNAGKAKVGDGISWLDGSELDIKGVTLSGNERQSVLIDGAVAPGSSIADLTLSGGDETKGVLQQNLPTGGMQPNIGSNAPQITASMDEQVPVPRPPAVPSL